MEPSQFAQICRYNRENYLYINIGHSLQVIKLYGEIYPSSEESFKT